MTAATVPAMQRPAQRNVSFGGVLRSEHRKLFTLRGTWILTSIAFVVMIGLASLISFSVFSVLGDYGASMTGGERVTADEMGFGGGLASMVTTLASTGTIFAGMLLGSVAVITLAGEYGTGSIVSTFTAVPRRTPVYLAKAFWLGLYGFLFGVVSYAVTLPIVGAIAGGQGIDIPLNADAWRGLLSTGLTILMVVWVGLGAAGILRNTAGAITTVAALMFVLPMALGFIPSSNWAIWFPRHLPLAITGEVQKLVAGAAETDLSLPAWDLWLSLGFWTLVPLIVGLVVVKRKGVR